jgi:hypothetical protein
MQKFNCLQVWGVRVFALFRRFRKLRSTVHREVRCLALERQHTDNFLFRGGLYSKKNQFMPESSQVMGKRATVVPHNAQAVSEYFESDFERIQGGAVFLGLLHNHFGHFLCDTLSRLWIVARSDCAETFVLLGTDAGVPAFAKDFFEMLGIADRLKIIVKPTLIDRLTIPDQAAVYPEFFHSDYLELSRYFQAVQNFSADDTDQPLFVSRRKLLPGYSRYVVGERIVDQVLNDAGVDTIYPESLTIEQQFRAFNRHKNIVGYAGSAMHSLLFTAGRKNVVYYSGRSVPVIYRKIDDCLGNRAHYLGVPSEPSARMLALKVGFKPELLDLPTLLPALFEKLALNANTSEYCFDDVRDELEIEYNTAMILRYVIEQKAICSVHIEGEFMSYAREYHLDREMIRQTQSRSPVLKNFFDGLQWDMT